MKKILKAAVAGVAMLMSAGAALADGELNIFNWGDYTSPEMIKKFEETHKVKVTITDYDSNDTALAKVRAGCVLRPVRIKWRISKMSMNAGSMSNGTRAVTILFLGSGA
jgi:hypothetical protein